MNANSITKSMLKLDYKTKLFHVFVAKIIIANIPLTCSSNNMANT